MRSRLRLQHRRRHHGAIALDEDGAFCAPPTAGAAVGRGERYRAVGPRQYAGYRAPSRTPPTATKRWPPWRYVRRRLCHRRRPSTPSGGEPRRQGWSLGQTEGVSGCFRHRVAGRSASGVMREHDVKHRPATAPEWWEVPRRRLAPAWAWCPHATASTGLGSIAGSTGRPTQSSRCPGCATESARGHSDRWAGTRTARITRPRAVLAEGAGGAQTERTSTTGRTHRGGTETRDVLRSPGT